MPDKEVATLNKLRRLEGNKKCICGAQCENFMGYGNICAPYRIFVCHLCKSSLQSFSFRCKVRCREERRTAAAAAARTRVHTPSHTWANRLLLWGMPFRGGR